MPLEVLDFRAVCGCFLPAYINFMVKRAKLKAVVKIAIVSLMTRVDGVMLGLLLVYLFWGTAPAMWRGRAKPRTHAEEQHEADHAGLIASEGSAATTERTVGPQNTPSKTATCVCVCVCVCVCARARAMRSCVCVCVCVCVYVQFDIHGCSYHYFTRFASELMSLPSVDSVSSTFHRCDRQQIMLFV